MDYKKDEVVILHQIFESSEFSGVIQLLAKNFDTIGGPTSGFITF